jgi:NitT/TauT family transport system substrate-binding protein
VKANEILATSDAAWERIRGLVKPKSDAEFAAIKAFYRKGIPQPWGAAETRSAEKLTKVLTDVGAARLMGGNTKFDPKLFHAAGS